MGGHGGAGVMLAEGRRVRAREHTFTLSFTLTHSILSLPSSFFHSPAPILSRLPVSLSRMLTRSLLPVLFSLDHSLSLQAQPAPQGLQDLHVSLYTTAFTPQPLHPFTPAFAPQPLHCIPSPFTFSHLVVNWP